MVFNKKSSFILFFIIIACISTIVVADCGSCDLFDLATDYSVAGNNELAIETFKNSMDQADKEGTQDSNFYQWVWFGIGKNYDEMGEYQPAIDAYKKALKYPGSKDRDILLWVIAKDYYNIAKILENNLPNDPSPEDYDRLADAYSVAYSSFNKIDRKSDEKDYSKEKQQYYQNLAENLKNSFEEKQNTGSLLLITEPTEAQVTLDGSLQTGLTPITITGISAGSHTLIFSKSGYLDVSMAVPVITDETSEFSISLPAESSGKVTSSDNSLENPQINVKESHGEDLTVGAIAFVYYKADSNDLSSDLTVKNMGTTPTARFAITYFLTPEQISVPFMDPDGQEIILGRDEINTLSAGESRKASTLKTFSLSGVLPGKYWFGVFVDSQDSIAETDEENNVQYWKEQIII